MVGSARKDAMDVESDRISSLPDDLIHKILSFMSVKDAVGTSVLSTRWRFIWTWMPYLNFENLNYGSRISKFISKVLSHRNNQIQLSSISLVLGRRVMDDKSVERILKCAFDHSVQQLTVTRSPGKIVGRPLFYRLSSIATPTWDFPNLTTLHLHHIQLCDDDSTGKHTGFFSKCTNLKNLSLRRCTLMKGTKDLNICLPRLSNLTLEYISPDMELEEYVNVVAPQLKNLTMIWCSGKHLISAPELASLVIDGSHTWQISTSGFPSLEKADICMYYPYDADPHKIVSLLQQLRNAKLLTLSLGILQRLFQQRKHLSSSMEPIPYQVCAFANAKISNFMTKSRVKVYLEVHAQEEATEMKNYETSPIAIFPMVSDEEMEAMREMASAQVLVNQLGMLLKRCKANTNGDTYKAHLYEYGKPQPKKHWERELQLNLEEMMALIKQSKFVASETCLIWLQCMSICCKTSEIISWLQEMRLLFQCIEGLMAQLPASKRAVMQPNYYTLCEDAAILTSNILGWTKTRTETQETNAITII